MSENFDVDELSGDEGALGMARRLQRMYAAEVPPPLDRRLAARLGFRAGTDRAWWPARLAAVALATVFIGQGAVDLFASRWLADLLDFAHEPHIYREAGFSLLAVAGLLIWGALRPRWLQPAVLVGSPLALAFGVYGLTEITHVGNPAAEMVHLSGAAIGLVLAALWWRAARYVSRRTGERRT